MGDRVGDKGSCSLRSVPSGWLEVMGHTQAHHQDFGSRLGLVTQPSVPAPSLAVPAPFPAVPTHPPAWRHPKGFSPIPAPILDRSYPDTPSQHPLWIYPHLSTYP